MNANQYIAQFEEILQGKNKQSPYDSEAYVNYVKMNQARIKRWTKKGKLIEPLANKVKHIDEEMHWLLITEPWCGDAAHSHAFISKLAELNPLISLTVQNRDAAESEIDNYLTNGSKSIPILVVRDAVKNDLFVWGPRPGEAQDMVMSHKTDTSISPDDKKKDLQIWYNKDRGVMMQKELFELFQLYVH